MFETLKEWMNVPLQIKPFVSKDGAGDKTYDAVVNTLCYPETKVTKVVNAAGTEVQSHITLYVDGDPTLSNEDNVIYCGKEYPVQALSSFFRNGVRSIWVVYI